ncbi:uroporphyrinogen decarboxylase [Acetobacterium fimetarium]|uniref:Uroporphyrinogen decarboxylase n=1 Tax=Acetobacterium fimetarium TaxID=52691 RepID=A0ABR6WYF9_9FIRM|nr:uroporphyrinogen decarboxylase family protein [Acetobacterium fimetarium]MBC3805668.1 uroporphyrinogen decarboxylase [Acetobacterium fimetarium]
MLTIKENLKEVMTGGKPDRFVKQYEFMQMIMSVPSGRIKPQLGGEVINEWGVTIRWPEGQIAAFPVHDAQHILLDDVTEWKKYVKAPSLERPEGAWDQAIADANAVDRDNKYVAAFIAPGLFEMTHYLMGMENALMSFYEEPEAMHELIDYLTQYELDYAKALVENLHPDAILHHDDWGSQISTFLSPAMFEEFFLESYKKIYGFYKANGVELIVHHSDSYAATLVPNMIEMGVDIWQGVMNTNNIPEMIKQYGGKITFMGGIHSGIIDHPEWSQEQIAAEVKRTCEENGKLYFIPSSCQGLPGSSFPGVYEATDVEVEKMTKELF